MSGIDRASALILWFEELRKEDVPLVGGKNANLGELISAGIPVPPGFAVTAYAYKRFITETGIADKIIEMLKEVDVDDTEQLQRVAGEIQKLITSTPMPRDIETTIRLNYRNPIS